MHNTTGDVALPNIIRETNNYSHDFVQYPKGKFLAFHQPRYVLNMLLNFGHSVFQPNAHMKKVLVEKNVIFKI